MLKATEKLIKSIRKCPVLYDKYFKQYMVYFKFMVENYKYEKIVIRNEIYI